MPVNLQAIKANPKQYADEARAYMAKNGTAGLNTDKALEYYIAVALDNQARPDGANRSCLDSLDNLFAPACAEWKESYESWFTKKAKEYKSENLMGLAFAQASFKSITDPASQTLVREKAQDFLKFAGLSQTPLKFVHIDSVDDMSQMYSPADFARIKASVAAGTEKLENYTGVTSFRKDGSAVIYINTNSPKLKNGGLEACFDLLKEETAHVKAAERARDFESGRIKAGDPNYVSAAAFYGNLHGGSLTAGTVKHKTYSSQPLEAGSHDEHDHEHGEHAHDDVVETSMAPDGTTEESTDPEATGSSRFFEGLLAAFSGAAKPEEKKEGLSALFNMEADGGYGAGAWLGSFLKDIPFIKNIVESIFGFFNMSASGASEDAAEKNTPASPKPATTPLSLGM